MRDDRALEHVLMTADAIGGVWTYSLALAKELADAGVRTTLVTMGPRVREAQRAEAASVPELRLVQSTFKLEWMDDPWQDVEAAGDWLLEIERRERPDVVHLNGYAHAALGWRAPTLVVAHSCVLSWWRATRGEEAPNTYERYRREVAAGLSAAEARVAPTRAMADSLRAHYGVERRVEVVPNGIEDRVGRGPRVAKEACVLTAGRLWDAAKNVATLVRASGAVRWPVYAAGAAEAPPSTVRALGWLDRAELHQWMARASIFALPARYEPFGLSVLEAARHRCALVLGDIPSLREIWGDAATYVSPDDDRAIAEVLNQLGADRWRLAQMGAAAAARADALSATNMGVGYMRLYRGLLSREPRAIGPDRGRTVLSAGVR